nr:hypothetical protein [uncultured Victivallis sp.]
MQLPLSKLMISPVGNPEPAVWNPLPATSSGGAPHREPLEKARNGIRGGAVVGGVDDGMASFGGEPAADRFAEAARSAGDQNGFS